MTNKNVIQKWLETFAGEVSENFLKKRMLASGAFYWHCFSFDKVKCIKGEKAILEYEKCDCGKVYIFPENLKNEQEEMEILQILKPKSFEDIKTFAKENETTDLYIVSKDFSWTFVLTHEENCGPYFATAKVSFRSTYLPKCII